MARTQQHLPAFFTPSAAKAAEKKREILDCYDINDLRKYLPRFKSVAQHLIQKVLVLDFDNTLCEPEDDFVEMGGDQWFTSFLEVASKVRLSEDDPNHIVLVLAIYHAVQHLITLKLIQPEVVEIIKLFQEVGWRVMVLTARGPEIVTPTLRELKRFGIDFSVSWGKFELKMDVGDEIHPPVFKNGIFFCGGKSKEECLDAFFGFLNIKPDIVYADDKRKYLEKMMHIKNVGDVTALHYRRLEEKVKNHNFSHAQQRLIALRGYLPDEAQEAMFKLKL